MQIEVLSRKIGQVPVPFIQIYFKDRQVLIPRSIRHQVLKNLLVMKPTMKTDFSSIYIPFNFLEIFY